MNAVCSRALSWILALEPFPYSVAAGWWCVGAPVAQDRELARSVSTPAKLYQGPMRNGNGYYVCIALNGRCPARGGLAVRVRTGRRRPLQSHVTLMGV